MAKQKLVLTSNDCDTLAERFANAIGRNSFHKIYGVPRGGVPVSYLLAGKCQYASFVGEPHLASIIVDDIVDSGATKLKYAKNFPGVPFHALCDYMGPDNKDKWVVFPWEQTDDIEGDESATDIVTRLLQYIGEDPNREGLKETPQRVLKAWDEWTAGYKQKPSEILKSFEDGSEKYNEMVIVKGLPFYSHCEHHLAPFFGTADIAYIPNGKVVGLSKIQRLLEVFSRRLQVQERLTVQIADALQESLAPLGVGVVLRARHLCMESRGVGVQGHHTLTSALRGKFFGDATVRQEFLSLTK